MADIRPELDFALYRTIAVGNLPDPDWAATLALPDDTASIRQSFPSNHAFAFTLILRDAGSARVAPGTMTYTGTIYSMLDDGADVSALEGAEMLLVAPYQVVGSGSVGFGQYAVNISAAVNIPGTVTEVEIWIKEI